MDAFQRHQLEVQYRILDRLDPTGGWERSVRLLREGIESEYASLTDRFQDPIGPEDAALVERILHMFESLRDSLDLLPGHGGTTRVWGLFSGFGLNDAFEGKLAGYCEWLFAEGRWVSQRPERGMNAHRPMLGGYREMLERFLPFDEGGRDYRTQPLAEPELDLIIGSRLEA
ncbi:MAG: YfbU family protein [Caulobacter sp.]|nr:YfbU family protein [Caulobacter sp.]